MSSFGKDTSQLVGVEPYGGNLSQRTNAIRNAKKESRSGGGSRPYWSGALKIPEDHSRVLRFIPGQHKQMYSEDGTTAPHEVQLEYIMFREHYHGGVRKGGICSAGPLFKNREQRDPCRGCELFWEDVGENRNRKKSERVKRMSMRDMYAFTVWDYGLWVKVTSRGNDGKEYYDWEPAPMGDPRAQTMEHKYGNLVHFSMGQTYFDTIFDYNDKTIQHDCATCGSHGSIRSTLKMCGNPQCQAVIVDLTTTTLTPEQLKQFNERPYNCPRCGSVGFAAELIECDNCAANGWTPRRASFFDVDLEVSATGSKGNQTYLQILNRWGPQAIQVQDPEVLQKIKPLSLEKIYSPTPMDRQVQIWGSSTPTQQQAPPQQFTPQHQYNQQPAQFGQPAMPPQHAAAPPQLPGLPGLPPRS